MANRKLSSGLLGLVLGNFAMHAHGQSRERAAAQISDCRVEFPNFATSGSLFEAAMRYVHDKSVTASIEADLGSRKAELDAQLRWLGRTTGYLIDIRIGTAKPPGQGSRLIGASFVGAGTTPTAALAANGVNGSLVTDTPSGFVPSPDESFMVWMTGAGSKLTRSCLVGPDREKILRDASVLVFSRESASRLAQAEGNARYGALAQAAEERTASKQARDRLHFVEQDRQANVQALAKINAELQVALETDRVAASVASTIGMLRGIVSAATMAGTAQAELGADAPPGLGVANDPDLVLKILDTYKERTGDVVITIRQALDVHVKAAKDSETHVRESLRNSGVPPAALPVQPLN